MSNVDERPAGAGSAAARRAMVESQLRPSGVNSRPVLLRMTQVPRENFVPAEARGIAYMDRAVPLALGTGAAGSGAAGPGFTGAGLSGRTGGFLAAPVFHGLMLQEAAPLATDHALVVDGGSGYLPELLRPMVASLVVMSPEDVLGGSHDRGDRRDEGRGAGFSLVLIDGAIEQVPPALAALLSASGRALTGLVQDGVTRLATGRRVERTEIAGARDGGTDNGPGHNFAWALLPLAELGIPILPQFAKPKAWSF